MYFASIVIGALVAVGSASPIGQGGNGTLEARGNPAVVQLYASTFLPPFLSLSSL